MNNPHIQNAIHTIGEANNPSSMWESGDTERIALQIEANTRATLAVAYAQDTANLIAMFGEGTWQDVENRDALMSQIKERLGLA